MVIEFLFVISWAWIPIASELVLSLNVCIRFMRCNVMLICLQMLTMKFIFDLKREVLHFVLAFQIVIMELFLNAHESYIVILVLWCLQYHSITFGFMQSLLNSVLVHGNKLSGFGKHSITPSKLIKKVTVDEVFRHIETNQHFFLTHYKGSTRGW